MARFNEILAGRYNRMLQKLFAIKGGAVAPQLATEIGTTVNLFNGVENRYLESWDRFGLQMQRVALAAVTSGARMRNPAGSNVIAVIEQILVSNLNAAAISYAIDSGASGVDGATIIAVSQARLDARGRANPTVILSTGNTLALFSTKLQPTLLTNVSLLMVSNENQELPLLPGDVLTVASVQVNVQADVCFIWRERALEESERA